MNQRPPGYEPDELPAALPRDIECLIMIAYEREKVREKRRKVFGGRGLTDGCKCVTIIKR